MSGCCTYYKSGVGFCPAPSYNQKEKMWEEEVLNTTGFHEAVVRNLVWIRTTPEIQLCGMIKNIVPIMNYLETKHQKKP